MIQWLKEQALLWDNIVDTGIEFRAVMAFISYLGRTGASPWVRVEDEQRPKDGQFIALLFDEGDGSRSAQGWSYSAGDMIAWPVCGATHWMPLPTLPKDEPCAS